MFLFNKNNALPRSRQSSIDSSVNDSSTSDAWATQCSDTSSYGDIPSPELQERAHPGKRGSVFNLRSRSNTTTTTSSFMTLESSMPGIDATTTHRSSQDLRHLATQSSFLDLPSSKRSLFARGKYSWRQSGALSPSLLSDEHGGFDFDKRISVLRKSRSRRSTRGSEGPVHDMKHRISSPFDFQHLTHTNRQQFAALEEASETELVAEFSTIRASQIPRRELNGIKAEDLHFQNFSSESLMSPDSRSPSALELRSAPLSPEPSSQSPQPGSPQQHHERGMLRQSRSVESFSQPVVKAHRHTQSAIAPPRASSRAALTRIEDLPEDDAVTGAELNLRTNRQSGMWDKFAPLTPVTPGEKLSTISDDSDDVGHAVTTPDNIAIPALTPPFSPDLENVPEEPERFFNPRPAPHPPTTSPRTFKSPKSPGFDSFAFRSTQRSPISRSNSRTSPYTSPKAQRSSMVRPISQMSDTLTSAGVNRRSSIRRPSSIRRLSNTWKVLDDSWEDDIDYIYDNALEADCDFDCWDQQSGSDRSEERDATSERETDTDTDRPTTAESQDTQTASVDASVEADDEPTLQTRFFPGAFRPSLLVPNPNAVPELESQSAVSASTAETGIQTPLDSFSLPAVAEVNHDSYSEEENFSLSPSLLIPQAYKEPTMRESLYDDLLADYESSDRHYPMLDIAQSVASSTRSSHVRSSKRSSYDSSLLSSSGMASSGSFSSPVRRSASSSGSLPELVHSRRARRNFENMVDQLTEQVASFSAFGKEAEDEEDDDQTPPGRTGSIGQTFFSAEEEGDNQSEHSEDADTDDIPSPQSPFEERAPLRHHKYAASDGVAKLLGSPKGKQSSPQQSSSARSRAASSSNAVKSNRQSYFSLFPAPPKNRPVITRSNTATN